MKQEILQPDANLQPYARRLRVCYDQYFAKVKDKNNVAALVFPLLCGFLLDGYSQPLALPMERALTILLDLATRFFEERWEEMALNIKPHLAEFPLEYGEYAKLFRTKESLEGFEEKVWPILERLHGRITDSSAV